MTMLALILMASTGFVGPVAFAYSSDNNAYIGVASNECTNTSGQTTIYFTQQMWTTTGNYNEWSAQMNSYAAPNSKGINFMQFNLAVDYWGDVYGAVEYWAGSQGSILNVHTSTLDTVGYVDVGSEFIISAVASQGVIYQVGFSFYDSDKGQWFSGNINIPSGDQVPLRSWQLNIVGENSGESVFFTYGTGSLTYSSYNSLTYLSSQPTCTQTPYGIITKETSNIAYSNPSISGGGVTQTFSH